MTEIISDEIRAQVSEVYSVIRRVTEELDEFDTMRIVAYTEDGMRVAFSRIAKEAKTLENVVRHLGLLVRGI